ncbi:hypothetical protein SCANM63S_04648 [Streptomyces canarius]
MNNCPSASASANAAPSNGCPALRRPTALTSPLPPPLTSSQYRLRWNGYVGRSTGRASGNSDGQSTATPRTKSSAAEHRNRPQPPWSRRRVPATTASGTVSSTPTVSTGCALTSTNVPNSSSAKARTAVSNRTVCRRLRNQYPASSSSPVTHSASTVEKNGTVARRGETPSSTRRISSRISSTCAE